ncbi:hypothetical protein UJ101_00556 [Flavobacteriaceae bacterium UJ101]|nr:hypothetical protein UJ101_00556 [Flavobacteriaceae bacterium UJ101]
MKKAYCAISYSNRKNFNQEIEVLTHLLSELEINLFVFVDHYNFAFNQEQEMMKTAFKEIDSCDFLIAELTTKSIGVGIEIGYAYATQKPIIYLKKDHAEYSTTASGCSQHIIEYQSTNDLINKIKTLFSLPQSNLFLKK